MEEVDLSRAGAADRLDRDAELVLGNVQGDGEVSREVDNSVLVNSGENRLLGEGADSSNPGGVLGSIQGLDIHVEGRNNRARLNIDPARDGEGGGHVGLNDDGETHVRGDEELAVHEVDHPLVVDLIVTAELLLQKAGVLDVGHDLLPEHLRGHSIEVVESLGIL